MPHQHRNRFPHSILYAGDGGVERQHYMETLQRHFRTVYHAAEGMEAWRLFERFRPDMVLTDIHLPGMQRFELIEKIRREDQHIPVVAIGSTSDPKLLLQAVRLHLYDYLSEPFGPTRLLDVMSSCARSLQDAPDSVPIGRDAVYSYRSKQIIRSGKRVALTHKEIAVLELLLEQQGYLVYYSTIEERVWGAEVMSMDALKSVIKKLRRKVPECLIMNVPGTGYQLEASV